MVSCDGRAGDVTVAVHVAGDQMVEHHVVRDLRLLHLLELLRERLPGGGGG